MKLLGRDIDARALVEALEDRLRARGLLPAPLEREEPDEPVAARVDPLTFNLTALEEHADPTAGMPLHTHRGGMGQAVVLAKWAFRKTAQVFINETLARQRVFNGHVRDSYAQLSAEVLRLRAEVDRLKAQLPSGGVGPQAAAAKPRARGKAPAGKPRGRGGPKGPAR